MTALALLLLISIDSSTHSLSARFIGNSAFEISDGHATILLDFPYKSGAFGYMTFPRTELQRRENSLCLFTHKHADHFDPTSIDLVGCSVAGPDEVQSAVSPEHRAGPGPTWNFRGATISCLPTPHADVAHCSYLITWHNQHFFVSGDVETLNELTAIPVQLGTLLLPSWLAAEVPRSAQASASRVVIHHHTTDEKVPPCLNCIVPTQGTVINISGAPPDPAAQRTTPR